MGNNILADIELNDKQIKAFNEELNSWKQKTRDQLAEEVRSEIQTEYEVKLRKLNEEKKTFKQEQVSLVEEIKTKMQKVMVKRFTSALKEMYDQLKVEARKDVLNDPRILALEEIKNVVFPLMDETVTKGYVDELQKALRMIEEKEDESDRLRARLKLKEITSTLSPVVAEAVEAFVGEATTEEEVVEKYSKLKNLVKEAGDKDDDDVDVELDFDEYDDEEDEDEDDEDNKKKRRKKRKDEGKRGPKKGADYDDEDGEVPGEQDTGPDEYDDDDDDDEEDEDMEEGLEINPTVHFDRKEKQEEYAKELNEMLDLAGVPKN